MAENEEYDTMEVMGKMESLAGNRIGRALVWASVRCLDHTRLDDNLVTCSVSPMSILEDIREGGFDHTLRQEGDNETRFRA